MDQVVDIVNRRNAFEVNLARLAPGRNPSGHVAATLCSWQTGRAHL